jgi:hypothetical protein
MKVGHYYLVTYYNALKAIIKVIRVVSKTSAYVEIVKDLDYLDILGGTDWTGEQTMLYSITVIEEIQPREIPLIILELMK